jgi:hypothetical protein
MFMKMREEDKAKIGFNQVFEDYLTVKELHETLHIISNTIDCFGKYDIYAKFLPIKVYFTEEDDVDTKQEINRIMGHIMMKPAHKCITCQYAKTCTQIHMSLEDLANVWDALFFSKAETFKAGVQ